MFADLKYDFELSGGLKYERPIIAIYHIVKKIKSVNKFRYESTPFTMGI